MTPKLVVSKINLVGLIRDIILPFSSQAYVTVSPTSTGNDVKLVKVLSKESGKTVQLSTISRHTGQVTGDGHSVGDRNLTVSSSLVVPSKNCKKT